MPEKSIKRLLPLETDVLILRIAEAEYAGFYKIKARFNNGEIRLIDFSQIIGKGVGLCKKLADLNYFKNFTLDHFTIDWNNEIGFAPEYLYEIGHSM